MGVLFTYQAIFCPLMRGMVRRELSYSRNEEQNESQGPNRSDPKGCQGRRYRIGFGPGEASGHKKEEGG